MCAATHPSRRGSVVVVLLWTISLAAVITTAIQLVAYRQAAMGRDVAARIQARWAARAGIERTIAVMADHTLHPVPSNAFAMVRDMEYVYAGSVANADYSILHHAEGQEFWWGPIDEHSKFNINLNQRGVMLDFFPDMTIDTVVAINDWIDADDEAGELGAERDWYLNRASPYEPRNGPLRHIGELELVAGVWPKYLRAEDWNLNARLDPNEDDAERSWPPDDPDEELDGGWSAYLTTYSRLEGATACGLPRLRRSEASREELQMRLGVDEAQADALIAFGSSRVELETLLTTSLNTYARQSQQEQQQQLQRRIGQAAPPAAAALSDEQLAAAFSELTMRDPEVRRPGKLNINTVPADMLRFFLVTSLGADELIAEEIIYMRTGRPEGITSIVDLREIPELTDTLLLGIARLMDTTSNVYTICSRGRSAATGAEVEIIAVVDRSTVPVRILEYREP